jgi:energy-coupling factor transport system permease protein
MSYRRASTPLHAARASVAGLYCLALAAAALILASPIALGVLALAVVGAGIGARSGRSLARMSRYAVPFAALICVINALASREGVTIIWRFGHIPLYGQMNVTLEATAYGGVLALRAIVLILCAALYTAAVDPDELLAALRRFSFRSALTATLATRIVPVLARDAGRLADAQRCRPGPPPSRLALMRATTAGVLDRALDVAAALEVRGYSTARPRAGGRRARSRHDIAFAAAAAGLVSLAILSRVAALAPFDAYPVLRMPLGPGVAAVGIGVLACAWLPFLQRRGVAR